MSRVERTVRKDVEEAINSACERLSGATVLNGSLHSIDWLGADTVKITFVGQPSAAALRHIREIEFVRKPIHLATEKSSGATHELHSVTATVQRSRGRLSKAAAACRRRNAGPMSLCTVVITLLLIAAAIACFTVAIYVVP